MRRLPPRTEKRFRTLAVELLEERNAPTPMSVSAIDSPALGVSGLEQTKELFNSLRFSGNRSSNIPHFQLPGNDELPGGATPASRLQAAPSSGSGSFVQTATAPAPQTFVAQAAVSGPQLFDILEQNPIDSFILQMNQHSSGGIPGGDFGSTHSGGGMSAATGGAGGGASGGGATAAAAAPASNALAGPGGGGLTSNLSSPAQAASPTNLPSQAAVSSPSSVVASTTAPRANTAALPSSPSTGPTAPASGSPSGPQMSSGVIPLISTQLSTAAILPTLYANTAADPAREVVQTTSGAQGGNPMTQGFSEAGVRYADGTIQLSNTDLASPGFGNPWGQTRNWTNGAGYVASNINGTGWIDSQMPFVQKENNSATIVLITSGTNARFFDGSGPTYTERYFLQDKLYDNTSAQQFVSPFPKCLSL